MEAQSGTAEVSVLLCTEWLKTVVTTRVEAERVFSSVGNVVIKLRTRLDDETLNALVFLKTYYSCRK